MQPRWTWQHAALAGLVLLTGLGATSLVASAVARCDDGPPSVLGLRLGLTPDMLRARFADASFRTELGEDVALVSDAAIAPGIEPGARFEFHDGQLVAVRVTLASEHADGRGEPLEVTPGTVLSRAPSARWDGDSAVHVVLLARTCPTHRGEAERLLSISGGTPERPESSGLP
jgi:hypothetical protein